MQELQQQVPMPACAGAWRAPVAGPARRPHLTLVHHRMLCSWRQQKPPTWTWTTTTPGWRAPSPSCRYAAEVSSLRRALSEPQNPDVVIRKHVHCITWNLVSSLECALAILGDPCQQAEVAALAGRLHGAAEAQAAGSAQLSQEVRALRSAVGDKETALAAIKVPRRRAPWSIWGIMLLLTAG